VKVFVNFSFRQRIAQRQQIDGSRKHQKGKFSRSSTSVISFCPFTVKFENRKNKKSFDERNKQRLWREMGNPTGEEIEVPTS
jgi:hypothetical protein